MADAAKRLAGPTLLTSVPVTQYTVPGSTTSIMRNIHVSNGTNGTVTFTLSIGLDAQGTRYFDQVPVQAHDAFDWSGFEVLAATEVLQAFASAAGALVITISGVEVS